MTDDVFISIFFSLLLPFHLVLPLFPLRSFHFNTEGRKTLLRYKKYQIGNTPNDSLVLHLRPGSAITFSSVGNGEQHKTQRRVLNPEPSQTAMLYLTFRLRCSLSFSHNLPLNKSIAISTTFSLTTSSVPVTPLAMPFFRWITPYMYSSMVFLPRK
mgnify:FL=1|jgi:hypothetical protein